MNTIISQFGTVCTTSDKAAETLVESHGYVYAYDEEDTDAPELVETPDKEPVKEPGADDTTKVVEADKTKKK